MYCFTLYLQESPESPTQEIFYDVPSIMFWDAVQFVTVRGSDKKVKGAFEPLDDNHSRNKDNIFSIVEKKYHFLAQLSHQPLFTCVLRRTSGVKALDVHAFVCSSDEEALSLLRTLNQVQRQYKAGEVHGTGVFEYSPFQHQPQSPASVPGTPVFPLPPSPRSPVDASRNVQSAESSRRQQHQHVQQPQHMAPNVPTVTGGHQVYQLKQDDFYVRGRHYSSDSSHGEGYRQGHGQGHERFGIDDNEVYSAIIEHDSRVKPSDIKQDEQFTRKIEYQSITKHVDLFQDTLNPSIPNEYSYHHRHNEPTHSSSSSSPTAKLGQGYSLLTGSHSPIPGQNTPRYADEGYEENPGWEHGVRRYHGAPHRGGYNHEQPRSRYTSHSSSTPPPSPQSATGQIEGIGTRNQDHYDVPKRSFSMGNSDRHMQLSERDNQGSNNVSVNEMKKRLEGKSVEMLRPSSNETTNVDRIDLYDIPKQPPRPVAKVHPHKIQGVRVLPVDSAIHQTPLKNTHISEQPNSRPKSMGFYDSSVDYDQDPYQQQQQRLSPVKKSSNERPKSQHIDQTNQSGNKTPQDNYQSNWQFKPSVSKDKGIDSGGNNKTPDSPMNDKLLLSKKKDAEIASVLQDLSFDHNTSSSTSSSGPSGTDFERSLGYLP